MLRRCVIPLVTRSARLQYSVADHPRILSPQLDMFIDALQTARMESNEKIQETIIEWVPRLVPRITVQRTNALVAEMKQLLKQISTDADWRERIDQVLKKVQKEFESNSIRMSTMELKLDTLSRKHNTLSRKHNTLSHEFNTLSHEFNTSKQTLFVAQVMDEFNDLIVKEAVNELKKTEVSYDQDVSFHSAFKILKELKKIEFDKQKLESAEMNEDVKKLRLINLESRAEDLHTKRPLAEAINSVIKNIVNNNEAIKNSWCPPSDDQLTAYKIIKHLTFDTKQPRNSVVHPNIDVIKHYSDEDITETVYRVCGEDHKRAAALKEVMFFVREKLRK